MGALNHQLQTAHRALKKKGKGIRKPEARAKRPRVLKELPSNSMRDAVDDPDPEDYAQDVSSELVPYLHTSETFLAILPLPCLMTSLPICLLSLPYPVIHPSASTLYFFDQAIECYYYSSLSFAFCFI